MELIIDLYPPLKGEPAGDMRELLALLLRQEGGVEIDLAFNAIAVVRVKEAR